MRKKGKLIFYNVKFYVRNYKVDVIKVKIMFIIILLFGQYIYFKGESIEVLGVCWLLYNVLQYVVGFKFEFKFV